MSDLTCDGSRSCPAPEHILGRYRSTPDRALPAAAPPPGERTEQFERYEYRRVGETNREWAQRCADHYDRHGRESVESAYRDVPWSECGSTRAEEFLSHLDREDPVRYRLVHPEPPAPAEPRAWPTCSHVPGGDGCPVCGHACNAAAPVPLPPGDDEPPAMVAAIERLEADLTEARRQSDVLVDQNAQLLAEVRALRAAQTVDLAAPVLPPGDDEPCSKCGTTGENCPVPGTEPCPYDDDSSAPVLPPGVTRLPDDVIQAQEVATILAGWLTTHADTGLDASEWLTRAMAEQVRTGTSHPAPGVTLPDESKRWGTLADGRPIVGRGDIPEGWDFEWVANLLYAVRPPGPPAEPRTERVPWWEAVRDKRRFIDPHDGEFICAYGGAGGGGTTVQTAWVTGETVDRVVGVVVRCPAAVAEDGTVEVLALGDSDD